MTTEAQANTARMNSSYCILVSSCDAYADCWAPFFQLFEKYWHPYNHDIYLNTETTTYAYNDLVLYCPTPGLSAPAPLGWGDRLMRCLAALPYDIVLYLQEDYFLKADADVQAIDRLADLMLRDGLSHISLLSRSATLGNGQASEYPCLSPIPQKADYRISMQAGLWSVSALTSYLRRHETVWEFEWYGTRRARRRRDTFLYVNDTYEEQRGKPMFPYDATGVAHGRWARDVVEELFAAHNIDINYGIRGFYDENAFWDRGPRAARAVRRLRSLF
jgi:hypothetical protein